MSVNKVILVGRLGKDPEVRYSNNGNAITNFNLATSRVYKNKQGEKVDETEWHRCVSFGRTAEVCGEYLSKGSQVYIEGSLQTNEWEDQEGNKRKTTEIRAWRMQMLGSRAQAEPLSNESFGPEPKTESSGPTVTASSGPTEDDIPF